MTITVLKCGPKRGYVHSAATKARMSAAQSKRQAERRSSEGANRSPYVRKSPLNEQGGMRGKGATQKIPCLCCRVPFQSQGPHNRLCYTCRRRDDDAGLFDVSHSVVR